MGRHLEEFASTTTMHGASKVISSRSGTRRFVWLVLFLAAWLMFAGQMYLVFERYFSYPIKVVTSIQSGGVPFPSITFCSVRRFDVPTLERLDFILKKNIILYHTSDDIPLHNRSDDITWFNVSDDM